MANKTIPELAAAGTLAGTELIELAQLSTSVTITAATLSAQASDNSYNDSGSGFVAAGFAVNDYVKVSGFTGNAANNIVSGKITALTTGKMTVGGTDGDVIVDDAAGESVTITKWLSVRTSNDDLAGVTVNTQTGTTYTYLASDRRKLVTHSNASAIAATLPQAGSAGFAAKWAMWVENRGAGTLTITPTTSTIDGAASLALTTNQGCLIVSDGTNYYTMRGVGSAGGGSTQGKHAIWIPAAAMLPSVTAGCAPLARVAKASNQPDLHTDDFDATTPEYAQFFYRMPKSWDEGTVTFSMVWSHAATTTNFGVVFGLQAVAVGDGDSIAATYGTAQNSTDTGGTTDVIYTSPESAAITVAGTPAAEDMVAFRISRITGDGSDTMAVDARLHGITLYITTNADTDA